MTKLILILVLISGIARAADFVEKHYKPTKGGVISYRLMPFGNDSRRESALEDVKEFCGGEYEVISESSASELGGAVRFGNTTGLVNKKSLQISFECKAVAP